MHQGDTVGLRILYIQRRMVPTAVAGIMGVGAHYCHRADSHSGGMCYMGSGVAGVDGALSM